MDGDALFSKRGMLEYKLSLSRLEIHKSGGLSCGKIAKFQGFSTACFHENTNWLLIWPEIGQSDLGVSSG
jgi:hypothetical protein